MNVLIIPEGLQRSAPAENHELVDEIDRRTGPRPRTAFIAELIPRDLRDERRWDDIDGDGPQARDGTEAT